MSNIKLHPRFVPTPGTPTAAPAYFPYKHGMLAEVTARKERRASVKDGKFRHCWGCVARSVCPFQNDCPRCAEMAA